MTRAHDFIRLRRVVAHKGDPTHLRGLVLSYVRFNSRLKAIPATRGNANGVKVAIWDGGIAVGKAAFGPRVALWRQDVCVQV